MADTSLARISSMESDVHELSSRIGEIERMNARPTYDNDNASGLSLGEIVANDPAVRALTSSMRGQAVVKLTGERAALTTATSTVGATRSQGTSLVAAQRLNGILGPYER